MHGDYYCCVLCDTKMSYSPDAEPKKRICPRCAVDFFEATGVKILTARDVVDWITRTDPSTVAETLRQLNYRPCYYQNEVDDAVRAVIGDDDGPGGEPERGCPARRG